MLESSNLSKSQNGSILFQDKKTSKVWIYVDLKKLNNACMHDPFPTPFTDEVLEGVGG